MLSLSLDAFKTVLSTFLGHFGVVSSQNRTRKSVKSLDVPSLSGSGYGIETARNTSEKRARSLNGLRERFLGGLEGLGANLENKRDTPWVNRKLENPNFLHR